ncbi:uncharacterized protein LOC129616116 isoform X2 [Condylostylus longicornis]|uniref:uncharacterized protein LOC129616116 isoform X2 n=1 Tax=Condylostylus longicornis TaxID=2530218 RepID=UPI00244DE169|nr:uncharacterized protein LOC129616116 isoform X2 [Condylostylus longicornis]
MPKEIFQNKKGCCVKKCKLMESILYNFPQDMELQNKWKEALQIATEVNDDFLVCSGHFNINSFSGSKYTLKEDSIPDRNLPPIEKGMKTKTNHTSKPSNERSFEIRKKLKLKIKPLRYSYPSRRIDNRSPSPDFYGFDLSKPENNSVSEPVIKPEKLGVEILYLQEKNTNFEDIEDPHSNNMSLITSQKEIKCCVVKCESTDDIFYKIPRITESNNKWSNMLLANSETMDDLLMCGTHFQEYNFPPIKYSSKDHSFSDRVATKDVNMKISENCVINKPEEINENATKIYNRSISPDFYGFDLKNECTNYRIEENPISLQKIKYEFEDEKFISDISNDCDSDFAMQGEEDFLAMQDIGIQTDSSDILNDVKLQLSILNNKSTKYFYETLNTPIKLECWTESENELCKIEYLNKIPIEEFITILMVHIRTNLNFLRMSVLFNMTEEEISYSFDIFLSILHSILYTGNNWPSKRHGESFCLIIELFEFSIEKNNSKHDKENTSIKALVGFNDIGNIIWCSKVYYNSISSHQICREEGIYDKLRRIDKVILEKDFEIQNEFNKRGLNYYTDDKPLKTGIWKIKNFVRDHIYSFEIFQNTIKHQYTCYIEKILQTICFLINEKS